MLDQHDAEDDRRKEIYEAAKPVFDRLLRLVEADRSPRQLHVSHEEAKLLSAYHDSLKRVFDQKHTFKDGEHLGMLLARFPIIVFDP